MEEQASHPRGQANITEVVHDPTEKGRDGGAEKRRDSSDHDGAVPDGVGVDTVEKGLPELRDEPGEVGEDAEEGGLRKEGAPIDWIVAAKPAVPWLTACGSSV